MDPAGGSIPVARQVQAASRRAGDAAAQAAPLAGVRSPGGGSGACERMVLETAEARDKAEALLRGLLRARASSARHLRAGQGTMLGGELNAEGQRGSSIDHAIESTRRMVRALDRAAEGLRAGTSEGVLDLLRDEAG